MVPLLDRRRFLGMSGLSGLGFLTSVSELLARADEQKLPRKGSARSVILLWMAGGPSQLETFDPHPGSAIGGGTRAIATSAKGIQIAEGLPRVAEEMASVSIIRSMVSKEGDHERGTFTMKTGFRPDPTVVHPSLGAILCHELPDAGTEIPRHISILPDQWSARGGFLGDQFDAFRMGDPAGPVPNTSLRVVEPRDQRRQDNLDVIEKAFGRGRQARVEATLHRDTMSRARKMMSSEQLKAFDVSQEPAQVRKNYGETPFGRACLAARRLIEVGVRCVEVTLSGWDSHINNHSLQQGRLAILDPAMAALLADLRQRGTLEHTLVLWGGEFGRTPTINPAGGRDHWPMGFSVALAGGGVRGGQVIGATDPGGKEKPANPVPVEDLHATILHACGIDFRRLSQTPIGRTVRFSEGKVVEGLLRSV